MLDVGEHDLFGEPLSSSDEDNDNPTMDKDGDGDGEDGDDADELADPEGLLNVNVDSTDDSRSPSKRRSLLGGPGTSGSANKDSLMQSATAGDNDDNAKDFLTDFSQGL